MASAQRKEEEEQQVQYGSTEEYITALQGWMAQLYQLQCVAMSFPYFLASLHSQASQGVPLVPPTAEQPSVSSTSPPSAPRTTPTTPPSPPPQQQQQQQQQQRQRQQLPQRGVEYKIPPVWKRLVAEAIDFVLLFVIKLAVTFAAVDTFDLLSDVKKYEFENLRADYYLAFQMTSEILVLELIHRVATCLFEALCLHRGSGGPGGATPGKKMVGLRVVYYEWVAPTAADQALVYPATDLGLARAVLRSVMKNFLLMFLLPVCLTFVSFQHNRTIYDVFTGSIVVEDRPIRQRNNNNNHNNNRN